MRRTRKEIADLAAAIVGQVLSRVMDDHERIQKVVNKIENAAWQATIDDVIEDVEESLLNKFDSLD